jgi:hypothetical protein
MRTSKKKDAHFQRTPSYPVQIAVTNEVCMTTPFARSHPFTLGAPSRSRQAKSFSLAGRFFQTSQSDPFEAFVDLRQLMRNLPMRAGKTSLPAGIE